MCAMTRLSLGVAAATLPLLLALNACGTEAQRPDISAGPKEVSTTTPAITTDTPTVRDADPGEYSVGNGYYRWSIGSVVPRRVCAITPATARQAQSGVTCTVAFPPGTPHVSNPPFVGEPNAIQIIPGEGWRPTISESGPPIDPELAPGTRIRVGDTQCTTLQDNGFDCQILDTGFRFHDGVLTTRGKAATPLAGAQKTTPRSDSEPEVGAPMENYDGSPLSPPGTICGAATGDVIVEIREGTISCDDAVATINYYRGLPADPMSGNTKNLAFGDGWRCMSPTAVMSEDLGYGSSCRKQPDGIHIVTPIR